MLKILFSLLLISLCTLSESKKNTIKNPSNFTFSILNSKPKKKKHKLKHRELKVHWKKFIENMDLKKKNPELLAVNTITIVA